MCELEIENVQASKYFSIQTTGNLLLPTLEYITSMYLKADE